jgi:hypothetical protein
MRLFQRPEPMPSEIRELMSPGEFVLAWANHSGGVIAITDRRLLSTDSHGSDSVLWQDSLSAKWDAPVLTLAATRGDQPASLSWQLNEPGLVPTAVRDRVTSVIVVDQLMDIPDVGRVRFIARRTSQGVVWTTVPDTSVEHESHSVQERIREALGSLRSTLGI